MKYTECVLIQRWDLMMDAAHEDEGESFRGPESQNEPVPPP